MAKTNLSRLTGILFTALSCCALAESQPVSEPATSTATAAKIQPFIPGSYRQILANHTKQPFLLVLWSVNCPSCMKDMALLGDIHKNQPELNIILLAADDLSATEQVQNILQKLHLTDLESWVFADDNDRKLRFEIDSKWYGEIPRTYFFNAAQQRTAVSGVLSKNKYDEMIDKILQ